MPFIPASTLPANSSARRFPAPQVGPLQDQSTSFVTPSIILPTAGDFMLGNTQPNFNDPVNK